jgi:hypothetical protein
MKTIYLLPLLFLGLTHAAPVADDNPQFVCALTCDIEVVSCIKVSALLLYKAPDVSNAGYSKPSVPPAIRLAAGWLPRNSARTRSTYVVFSVRGTACEILAN